MSTFVLVHGSWHGRWCWDKVVPLLQRAGHQVIAPDLPGHGKDNTSVPQISLQAYADRVVEILDAQPEPVILVGHSMGGIVVSQAAEYRPGKIKTLVYLAAFLLRNGESLFQVATTDTESLLVPNLIPNPEQGIMTIKDDPIRDIFYADCAEADAARAKALLRPEPIAPTMTPLTLSEANYGGVPRVFIETLQDKTLSPRLQQKMYADTPCRQVISMNTSHSPFLAAPGELADHLISVAAAADVPVTVSAVEVPIGL